MWACLWGGLRSRGGRGQRTGNDLEDKKGRENLEDCDTWRWVLAWLVQRWLSVGLGVREGNLLSTMVTEKICSG